VSAVETTRSRARLAADSSQVMVASVEPSHGRFGRFYYGMFVEEWEAVSIRVARVVVEPDAYLAGSYPTTSASFFPCHGIDVFRDEFGSSSAAESSSVVANGKVAVWESWEASETMVISMSSLERPLEADPMILISSRRCVPVTKVHSASVWSTLFYGGMKAL
jgi:hypothetical protein